MSQYDESVTRSYHLLSAPHRNLNDRGTPVTAVSGERLKIHTCRTHLAIKPALRPARKAT
jgi:hypothetical protein